MVQRSKAEELQADLFAEDVPIPDNVEAWTEEQLTTYFESGGEVSPLIGPTPVPVGGASATGAAAPPLPREWLVSHDRVAIRATPATKGKAVGLKARGDRITVAGREGDWLRLDPSSLQQSDSEGWMLIDGTSLGLGVLLKPVSPTSEEAPASPPPKGAAAPKPAPKPAAKPASSGDAEQAFIAPVCFEVVHAMVHVRDHPDVNSRSLGSHRKGEVLLVEARKGAWLRLAAERGAPTGPSRWMLSDGASVGLKLLMQQYESTLPGGTCYQVTRSGPCLAYDEPGGLGKSSPNESLQEGVDVDVLSECGHWVKLRDQASFAWVELDIFLAG